jgi:SAM-dependent methyltransferase
MIAAGLRDRLQSGLPVSDREFDACYTRAIQKIAEFHFTPVAVAQAAASYLVTKPGTRVLDIGSGAGKFCLIGAASTQGHFTGIEYREALHLRAQELSGHFGMPNTHFMHMNILEVEFAAYDAVYLFNPFYEHIDRSDPIDRSVPIDRHLYDQYCLHVKKQLDNMPPGTRLATYFSYLDEVPDAFRVQATEFDGKLKFWQKVT